MAGIWDFKMARHVSRLSQCTVEHLLKNTDPLRLMDLFSTRVSVFKRIGFHFNFSMSPIVALHSRFASCHCILN